MKREGTTLADGTKAMIGLEEAEEEIQSHPLTQGKNWTIFWENADGKIKGENTQVAGSSTLLDSGGFRGELVGDYEQFKEFLCSVCVWK